MTRYSRRDVGAMLLGGAALAGAPFLGGCGRERERVIRSQRRGDFTYGSPSDHGVDSRAVLAFLDAAAEQGIGLHSIMLYRRGHVVAEGWWWPYRADRRHMMHSLTKSVTACGVGLALAEKRFALEDKVLGYFRDELPPNVDPRLEALTVRDLLTMQTGHGVAVSGSVWRQIKTSWVTEFFKLPIVHDPGTTFVYNSASSFMLSALVTKTTGEKLRDYLEPRFFAPLGIRDLDWDIGPGGINPGGNGLSWTSADSLKLGIVHLNKGRWNDRQLLPAEWVEAATRPQSVGGRYGYQWWMGPNGNFYAVGLFGQLSVVFPQHDAVLELTAGVDDEQLLKFVWQHFPGVFDSAPMAASDAALTERCANLRVLPPLAPASSPLATTLANAAFDIDTNDDGVTSVGFEFTDERCSFTLRDARGEHTIIAGLRDWHESSTTMTGAKLHHQYEPDRLQVVAGGRWTDERTFEMTWQFVETAFQDRLVCRFDGVQLRLDRSVNVNSAATFRPTLTGKRAG